MANAACRENPAASRPSLSPRGWERPAASSGGEITALNAASLSNKLAQIANGAFYGEDGSVVRIHDRKLDALEDVIESMNGRPLLVAYWFRHDLQRIRERFDVRELRP